MPLTSWTDSGTTGVTFTGTWTIWNNTATSTATATTWGGWGETWASSNDITITSFRSVPQPPETDEQKRARIAAQEQRVQERRIAQEQRDRERLAAQERAEQLLRDQLTIEQVAQLVRGDYFDVISESGKRYRVQRGYSKNVALLKGERIIKRYCIHPDSDIPVPDAMLAQKLMLESMEAQFLRIANVHPAEASFV